MENIKQATYQKQLNKTLHFVEDMNWENKKIYANFLAQTYYFVSHSTRLLARSISFFSLDQELFYSRFVEHLKEENNHEKIALKDLEILGEDLKFYPQSALTQSFWECQYYKIETSKGISLLGYILFLEAAAVKCFDRMLDRITVQYGAPACKFVKIHVNEDPEHLDHALDLIYSLSLPEQEIVWQNFVQSSAIYGKLLAEIEENLQALFKVA